MKENVVMPVMAICFGCLQYCSGGSSAFNGGVTNKAADNAKFEMFCRV